MDQRILIVSIFALLLIPTSSFSFAQSDPGRIDVLGYSPYRAGQDPNGPYPSPDVIRKDIKILDVITDEIRVYETNFQTERIVSISEEYGVGVHLSVNIDQDNLKWQIMEMAKIANNHSDTIKSVILDKATRGNNPMPVSDMESIVSEIRNKLSSDIPITMTGSMFEWRSNPQLFSTFDHVLLVSYAYWDGLNVDDSIGSAISNAKFLEELSGKKVIVETGYPSQGDIIDCAEPTPQNQSLFIENFIDTAKKEKIRYVLFSSFSQTWKPHESASMPENPQCNDVIIASVQNAENHWGMFSVDRKIQQGLSEFTHRYFENIPVYSILTINTGTQCDVLFKPYIKSDTYNAKEDSLVIDFEGGDTKINDIKLFYESSGKLIQEMTADYPFKIIISSQDVNVFSEIMIGVNCGSMDVVDDIVYGVNPLQVIDIDNFEIKINMMPTAYAVCSVNEQCMGIDVKKEIEPIVKDDTVDAGWIIMILILAGIAAGLYWFFFAGRNKTNPVNSHYRPDKT